MALLCALIPPPTTPPAAPSTHKSFREADIFVIGGVSVGVDGGVIRDTSIVDQPDVHRDEFPQDWRPRPRAAALKASTVLRQPPIASRPCRCRRRQFRPSSAFDRFGTAVQVHLVQTRPRDMARPVLTPPQPLPPSVQAIKMSFWAACFAA